MPGTMNMHMQRTIPLLLALIGTGCPLEPIGEGGDADMLPAEVQRAFDESCATSTGCHASGAPQVVLDAPGSSEILDKSSSAGGGPFVTLGNVDESYLAQKILGGSGITGSIMPPSPQSPRDAVNTAIIVGWIAGVPLDGEGETGGDGDGDGDGDGSPAPECFIEGPLPAMPSFETDIWPMVEARCALEVCHGGSTVPVMSDAMTAYDNLVDMPASTAMLDYVEPGSADQSYLWHKLAGTQATVMGGGGATMPAGAPPCTIELQAVYAWITTGAQL